MSLYIKGIPTGTPESYLSFELEKVQRAFADPNEFLLLQNRAKAPERARVGMVALADGTNWNPGSGAGVYCYHSGQWNKLG